MALDLGRPFGIVRGDDFCRAFEQDGVFYWPNGQPWNLTGVEQGLCLSLLESAKELSGDKERVEQIRQFYVDTLQQAMARSERQGDAQAMRGQILKRTASLQAFMDEAPRRVFCPEPVVRRRFTEPEPLPLKDNPVVRALLGMDDERPSKPPRVAPPASKPDMGDPLFSAPPQRRLKKQDKPQQRKGGAPIRSYARAKHGDRPPGIMEWGPGEWRWGTVKNDRQLPAIQERSAERPRSHPPSKAARPIPAAVKEWRVPCQRGSQMAVRFDGDEIAFVDVEQFVREWDDAHDEGDQPMQPLRKRIPALSKAEHCARNRQERKDYLHGRQSSYHPEDVGARVRHG
jgi:hypothetical protein